MSSNEKLEREFEAFLNEEDSRLTALYRKLPQSEPDARLDAAVRAMAKRALKPQLVATPERRRRARWVPALGAAAALVLAAGIAYRLGPSLHDDSEYAPAKDVDGTRRLDTPAPAAAPPPAVPREASTPTSMMQAGRLQGAPAADLAPAPAAKAGEMRGKAETPALPAQAATDRGTLAKTAPFTPAPRAFPGPAEAQKRASEPDAAERKQITTAGARQSLDDRDADEAARNEHKRKSPDEQAPTNAASAAAQHDFATQSAQPAYAPAGGGTAPANVPAAPPTPAAARESAATPRFEPRSAPPAAAATSPEQRGDAARSAQGGAATNAAAAAKPDRAVAPQRMRSTDPNATLYPEHWLANIRQMLQDGRREEAVRSLGEFRRLYPDYQLPDDLRDLK